MKYGLLCAGLQAAVDGVSAESLNSHYASISEDRSYLALKEKSSVTLSQSQEYITEWQVFTILDHLRRD